MFRTMVILIAVLGLVLAGTAVQAETCNFNVSSGNWTDDGSWSCGHEPTAGDVAVIQSGNTCTMDDAAGVADSLTVESTATLNIQASKKLTLDDSGGNGSTITGTVNLQGSASELAFVDNNQTIDGSGKIVGQHNAAKITVGLNLTLTSETTIEGTLQITGLGAFKNQGLVWANAVGILEISTNTLSDDGSAEWKVSGSASATLLLNPTSSTFQQFFASFTLTDNGKLEVESGGFSTKGSLYWGGGTITLAPGVSVEFGFNS